MGFDYVRYQTAVIACMAYFIRVIRAPLVYFFELTLMSMNMGHHLIVQENIMTVTYIHPSGLVQNDTHHHVAVSTGTRHVHVSGQVALNEKGELVGENDLAAQTAQAFRNVGIALNSANATFGDVVRLKIYVARWKPEMMAAFGEGLGSVIDELQIGQPPASVIGVDILYIPEYLIEIEATAIID
jgi:enamine deaminase RidA (YjgF/YER057c/UK114 family)